MLNNLEPADEHAREMIGAYIFYNTLEVFQQLNKHLNGLGLCISISSLPNTASTRLGAGAAKDDNVDVAPCG